MSKDALQKSKKWGLNNFSLTAECFRDHMMVFWRGFMDSWVTEQRETHRAPAPKPALKQSRSKNMRISYQPPFQTSVKWCVMCCFLSIHLENWWFWKCCMMLWRGTFIFTAINQLSSLLGLTFEWDTISMWVFNKQEDNRFHSVDAGGETSSHNVIYWDWEQFWGVCSYSMVQW